MCESEIETFADSIAIVGDGAYNADIGVSRIEARPPDFLYAAGVRCDTSHHRVDGPDRSQRQVLSDMQWFSARLKHRKRQFSASYDGQQRPQREVS
jgi:hypothetical protein